MCYLLVALLTILSFSSALFAADEKPEVPGLGPCAQKVVSTTSLVETLIAAIRAGSVTADYIVQNRLFYNITDPKDLERIRTTKAAKASSEEDKLIVNAKKLAPSYGLFILRFLEESKITDTSVFPEIIRLAFQYPQMPINTDTRYKLYVGHLKKFGYRESLAWMGYLIEQDSLLVAIYRAEGIILSPIQP